MSPALRYGGFATVSLALASCGGGGDAPRTAAATVPTGDWRTAIRPGDRDRLREWRTHWVAALAQARGGDGGAIARDPALYDPDRAGTGGSIPPAGNYRCRVIKLGSRIGATAPGEGRYVAYPVFDCTVDLVAGRTILTKTSGLQRPVGQLYADAPGRAIFLGTLVLGDERRALPYGRDAARDMVGVMTRIGPRRWRLALPAPSFESRLDLVELTAAD